MSADKYTIKVNLIPGLIRHAFRNGVGKYEGVVMHATAVYDDTADTERNYEVTHWRSSFVHAFVDDKTIEQVADFNYVAWGAGPHANQRYLHFELCQSKDPQKFAAAYDRWTWLAAKALYDKRLGVIDNVTLRSHAQVSAEWHESDHTDPIDYLASHGKTWQDVVHDVTAHYNEMAGTQVVVQKTADNPHPTLKLGNTGGAVVELQKRLGIPADGVFGPQTLTAVKNFQNANHLPVDGIVGAQTWAALTAKPI